MNHRNHTRAMDNVRACFAVLAVCVASVGCAGRGEILGAVWTDDGGAPDGGTKLDVSMGAELDVSLGTVVDGGATGTTGPTGPGSGVSHDASVRGVDVTPPPTTATVLGGCGVFPTDNPWNEDITSLPVHPNSRAIIRYMQTHGDVHLQADFGHDPATGIPFVVIPAAQPMSTVHFTEYPSQSDPGPYPVPPTAPIEVGRDHHVLVLQEGSCTLYEMYHAARAGSVWNAGSGAVFHLGSDALRPLGWTSCDQAGLPILPGLVRYDEVQSGAIHHALRFTVENPGNGFIPPATHPSGGDPNAPPMGMRFRLRADFDIEGYTGAARVILNALRTYGMLVADTGTNWFVSGATDSRWNDDDLNQLMNVPGTAFEVVYTGAAQGTQM